MPYVTSVERFAKQDLILRLLNRRVGALTEGVRSQITALPIAQLELLGDALLEFSNRSGRVVSGDTAADKG